MTAAPPGRLPETSADPQALIEEARRRQRRRYLLTGLVTVALLAGAAGVAISQRGPGRRSPAHLGSSVPLTAAPADYSSAPAYYAYLDEGDLFDYTSHGTQYSASVPGRYLKVRATASVRLLATISPPRPYNDFRLLTADADGRRFVLGAMHNWQHRAGPSARLVLRNQRTPLAFLMVQITSRGHVQVSRLSLPGRLTLGQAPSIALSPDGMRLAVAFHASGPTATLQVITLSTGRARRWTAPGASWTPLLNGAGAWTADGRTLAFQQRTVPPIQRLRADPALCAAQHCPLMRCRRSALRPDNPGAALAAWLYDGSVAETVTAVPGERRIEGDGWSLRADRLELLPGNDWWALIGVRRGLNLVVTWSDQSSELDVAAWAGEPEKTDGVAVIDLGNGDLRLARVPLCGCGDRGCGNIGIQFAKWLPGEQLPALVELFRELPWTQTIPTRSNVLVGHGLAALEDPGTRHDTGAKSYLYAPGTGEIFPLGPDSHP